MIFVRFNVLVIAIAYGAFGGTLAQADPPIAELLKLHTHEAEAYRIFRDRGRTLPLELETKPIFSWTNLVGEHTQYGHLYAWSYAGRPEVIGTMFSTRASSPRQRILIHEFHTLATRQLFPETPENSAFQWTPERGITLAALGDAPSVAESSSQRRQQMRKLARSFAAESRTRDGQTWGLRLLPRPLLEFEPSSEEVLEGALFAMVSSAGTDPEVLLMIEARHPPDGKTWAWHGAALRFSDKELTVKYNDQALWSSRDDDERRARINGDYTLIETGDKTYMCYRARIVDELPDANSPPDSTSK